jgi:predicted ATPase/transcriptional regulator with XRE-family HTH domain
MAHASRRKSVTPRTVERPYWSAVLWALREARGLTQEGWAAQLGFGRATIRRWESGENVPDARGEKAILDYCEARGLFRSFAEGPLRGHTLSPEWLADLLATARLGGDTTPQTIASVTDSAVTSETARTEPSVEAGNLPIVLTGFIGRTLELAHLSDLLAQHRLVTLTGPGGSGKTRLAFQVAGALRDRYPDGVWLVELAALTDPALVVRSVATVVGLREVPDDEVEDALVRFFRLRRCLLLLDNCEHLVDASARIAALLVGSCPSLTILATSREHLRVGGEEIVPVPPLTLPDHDHELSVDTAALSEAVQLFVARASAARPTFRLEPENVRTVVEICRRLDGIPLALELAAARIKLLSCEEVAERLNDRFRLLTSSSAVILPRHQTLRAAVDWSYDLLSDTERRFFARLSVFPGGWTVPAAEQVCSGAGIDEDEALDLLGGLVEKSLVTVDEQHGVLRYRLLETLRVYAWEKLEEFGEADSVCEQRESWLMALAEQPVPEHEGPELTAYLLRLELEVDNFRAALAWRLGAGVAPEQGLRLAAALGPFWEGQGGNAEGLRWIERFLAACPDAPAPIRASALFQSGKLASWSADYVQAVERFETSLALYEQTNDPRAAAAVRFWMADSLRFLGDNERAGELLTEALTLYRGLEDQPGIARTLRELAMVAMFQGDFERAESLCEESLALYRMMGDRLGMSQPLSVLVRTMFASRDYARAAEYAEQALALSEEIASRQFRATLLVDAGMVQSALGFPDRALELERESLRVVRDSGTKMTIHTCLGAIGAALHRTGQSERGARLLSASVALLNSLTAPIAEAYRPLYEATMRSVQRRMDPDTFAAAWEAGQALSLDAAIAEALDERPEP